MGIMKRPVRVVRAEWSYELLQATVNGWQPKCYENPAPFTDFVVRPTEEEAAALCKGCPMLALCDEYGAATKAHRMVLGGVLWIHGKPAVEAADNPWIADEVLAA